MSTSPLHTLIRLRCDCELSPEQAVELERHLAENPDACEAIRKQLEFEERLRARVGEAIKSTTPCCPDALVQRIRACCCGCGAAAEETGEENESSEKSAAPMRLGRSRFFWSGPQRANAFAIAATLALIAGAVLYGIYGRSIDDIPMRRVPDLVADAASFADQEHGQCTGKDCNIAKIVPLQTPQEVERDLSAYLGHSVKVFDFRKAGYEFIGAGHCQMPVPQRCGHLVYRKVAAPGEPAPMASVFIVPNAGGCRDKLCQGKKPGEWYPVEGTSCRRKVVQSTDGTLVYFVVCCADRDLPAITQQIELSPGRIGIE